MPFPNFHAFRVKNSDLFKSGSFRTMEFKHNNKPYSVIMGQLKGKDTMTAQTYRYPKKYWTTAQAKAHGMAHDKSGMFEAAKADTAETTATDHTESRTDTTPDVSRASFCRLDTSWNKTDEGFIDALVYPTRIGVFPYFDRKLNKIVYEYRSAEEVGKADSLKSLEGKDLTNNHPEDMVKSHTFKALTIGSLYGPHEWAPDKIHTQSRVMVKEPQAVMDVEGGKNQVSCGYRCDLLNVPGTWRDPITGTQHHYDRQQINIKYNHLALVDRGRMGPEARLRADSGFASGERFDAYEIEIEQEQSNEDTSNMTEVPDMKKLMAKMTPEELAIHLKKIMKMDLEDITKMSLEELENHLNEMPQHILDIKARIKKLKNSKQKVGNKKTMKLDGREFTCDDVGEVLIEARLKADADKIQAEKERADKAEAEAKQAKADAEKVKTDAAALQAAHDVLKADLDKAQKLDMAQLVKDRVALIASANKIAKNDKYDSMTDVEIKRAAVKAVYDWADFAKNDSETYLQGLFEAASKTKKDGSSVVAAYDDARTVTFDSSGAESRVDWDNDPCADEAA